MSPRGSTLALASALILVSLTTAVVAQPSDPATRQQVLEMYSEASSLYVGGDFEGAVGKVREILKIDPTFYRPYYLLVLIGFEQEKYKQVLADADKYFDLEEEHPGWLEYHEQDPTREDAEVAEDMVVAYLLTGDYSQAAQMGDTTMTQCMSLHDYERAAAVAYYAGLARLELNDQERAKWSFEWALRLAPRFPEAVWALLRISGKDRDREGLVGYLSKGLTMDPEGTVAFYRTALPSFRWLSAEPGVFKRVLLSLGDNEQNRKALERIVALHGIEVDWSK
jgi:tetratricopeptide (TPR) repeat protein